jgi:hypothetical protein
MQNYDVRTVPFVDGLRMLLPQLQVLYKNHRMVHVL